MRALLLMVALTGCIEPSLLVCEDGTACPSGSVCLTGGGCGAIEDVNACSGVANGEPCTSAFGQGRCRGGACRATRCGDNVLDADEVCDDGNTENGDGCSGNCRSTETCGNGISELTEACDCGDALHPGGTFCAGTFNGGSICRSDCTLARCGNHELDPGEVCDDGNAISGDGCNSQCTSDETCGNGVTDVTEQCDDGNLISGDTCQSTCTTPRCGDHFQDAGEICDDGNNTPGDGCAFDCMSTEVCGNHITDFFAGEQCDDGKNGLLHDGCTDTCAAEQTVWLRSPTQTSPGPRHAHALVYDSTRKTVIMFGGATGSLLQTSYGIMHAFGDTWEWDPIGLHWTDRTSSGPSTRFGHAMAYDSVRHRVVLFGGFSGSTPSNLASLGDTWEWDSATTTWTQRAPATSPPARGLHSMAFDPVRGRVVLFGGGTASTIGTGGCGYMVRATFTDTWEWDGTNWTQRTPTLSPPASVAAGMVFDSTRSRIVLTPGYGGQGDTGTWEWNGAGANGTWASVASAYSPSNYGYGVAYDPTHDKIVELGGENWNTSGCGLDTAQNSTFIDDRSTGQWTDEYGTPPPNRSFTAATFVPDIRQTFAFGGTWLQGYSNSVGTEYGDAWGYNGTSWASMAAPTPPNVHGASMAYDSAHQQVVLFGGAAGALGSDYATAETWIWDGATWTLRSPAQSPPNLAYAAMAYDARREKVVLFGGNIGAGSSYTGTWEWDGTNWTQRTFSTTPSFRSAHAMAYDASRGVIVLFGGSQSYDDGNALPLGDTWEYDGSYWTQRATTGPSPRVQHAMAYDAVRRKIVLFGGSTKVDYTGRDDVGDTWEWDGNTWTQRSSTGPTPRDGHILVEDPQYLGVVLFGGRASVGLEHTLPLDTWRWDGVNGVWVSIPAVDVPDARFGHVAAYDAARHDIVVAFGVNDIAQLSDTWLLRTATVGVFAPRDDDCSGGTDLDNDVLRGCADPDCWSYCNPACPPGTSCPLAPKCGDHICQAPRENSARCPGDCP